MASNEGDLDATPESFANSGETYGHLNQHPKQGVKTNYRVGVSVDRNRACRRTMEDSHSFIYDFAGLKGQGYFAIFDGHAGVKAAEYCGLHFHEHLLANLAKTPDTPIPHLLNATFHSVDTAISELSAREGSHSGCTAVACLLRLEDEHGNPVGEGSGVGSGVATVKGELDGHAGEAAEKARENGIDPTEGKPGSNGGSPLSAGVSSQSTSALANSPANDGAGIKDKLKSMIGSKLSPPATPARGTGAGSPGQVTGPAQEVKAAKKTLYTANAGDARAVLARGGEAIRLSYDHKGSDPKEIKRIEAAGGYVAGQRVNGYLAVTRALGDSQMKQFVVGAPYTTETAIRPEDEFLIIACDGLWDVCSDQQAVDLIAGETDPQQAADKLLQYALTNRSTDNLSVMVIQLNP
ncbi:mgpp2cl-1, protein phosphatase 2C-like protein 1 [Rhodosporidiobolus nylandii]